MGAEGRNINEESRAFKAGATAGRIAWFATIGIFVSALGFGLIEGFAPHGWRAVGAVLGITFGVSLCVVFVIAGRNAIIICFGAYMALVGVGSVLQSHHPRPTGALIGIAVATIVTSVTGTFLAFLSGRRSKELDRLLFTESISVAFFVTMLGSLAYALLEAWIKAPKLSMWVVFTVGMWSWAIATMVFRRRYT